MTKPVRLMFVCDFPPSERGGGDTLLWRLLGGYPADSLYLVYARSMRDGLQATKFASVQQTAFADLAGSTQYGLKGQLLMTLDRCLLLWHSIRLTYLVKLWDAEVLLTVAHGCFFLAAVASAKVLKRPVVLIVHDDWPTMQQHVRGFRRIAESLFRWAIRNASWTYVIGEAMASRVLIATGVKAEIQYPSAPAAAGAEHSPSAESNTIHLTLVFAGNIYGNTTYDSLDVLIKQIKRWNYARPDEPIQLICYSNYTMELASQAGWVADNIYFKPWVKPDQLQVHLRMADALVLPISLNSDSGHYARTSFPAKLADYLAAGRPVLALAPQSSEVCSYIRKHGCGVVVCAANYEEFEEAFRELKRDIEGPRAMGLSAKRVHKRYHDSEKQKENLYDKLRELASGRACKR